VRRGAEEKATRLNLLRSRRKLERVREGSDLLKRKREALVRELLSHARPAVDTRVRIARAAGVAYPALLEALAADSAEAVGVAALPLRDVSIEAETTRLWGLTVATVSQPPRLRRTLEARGTVPGPTGAATVEAADAFEALAQLLVEAAPREMLLRELGRAVSRTSRQVRGLERRVEPSLSASVRRMTTRLDEREREEQTRLRHFLRRQGRRRSGSARSGAAPVE
jgi:H(+)-transporting ATP synthase subunit D